MALVWADVPVKDIDRAVRFYSHVLGMPLDVPPDFGGGVALVRGVEGPSIDLVQDDPSKPTTDRGTTIYLSSNGDIDGMIARVEEAGGRILGQKQLMGDVIGWLAYFEDTEGNRIGIHEPAQQGQAG